MNIYGNVYGDSGTGGTGVLPAAAAYSPAHVLAQYLLDNTVVSLPGGDWPVYISHLPDTEDTDSNAVCVYNPPGLVAGRSMDTGEKKTFPGIQIRVRAEDDPTAYAKALALAALLDGTTARPVVTMPDASYRLDNLSRTSTVAFMGVDADGRNVSYTINARATIKKLE